MTSSTTLPTAVPLYGPEHAADPERSYARLRQQGAVGIAEVAPGVAVYLVVDYRAALDLLQDTDTWTKDTRNWMDRVPPDSPIRPMVEWRPSLFFADGEEHAQLRRVITDSLGLLDPAEVRQATFRYADTLIQRFSRIGVVDLVASYAYRMPLMVFNGLFGAPDDRADQLIDALSDMVTTDPATKARGEQALTTYLSELYAQKAERRGDDLTSWFIDHPRGLSPEEVVSQITIMLGAGNEALCNLIASTLVRLLSDQRYRATLTTGSLPIAHAIDEALWQEAPIANYSLHFPRAEVNFHGTVIPADAPVMVSFAAANSCPYSGAPTQSENRSGHRAHLSWAAGPHACPASSIAYLVATAAIERLISVLPDITLATDRDQLTYHSGPVFRSLTALPARFTPVASTGHTP